VKLQAAGTSVETDRDYILNIVAGVDEKELNTRHADASHLSYSNCNAEIRGRIATLSLGRAVVAFLKGDPEMFDALLDGLGMSNLTRCDLRFGTARREGLSVPLKVYERLLDAMPHTIEHVVIELPKEIEQLPANRFKQFPKLHTICITSAPSLADLPEDIVECYSLTRLDLCGSLVMKELPKKIFDLKGLTHLDLTGSRMLQGLYARGVAKSKLETLILTDCTALTELPATLGTNLVNLQQLTMTGCSAMVGLPPWVAEMERAGVAVQRPSQLA